MPTVDIHKLKEFDDHQNFYELSDSSIGLKAFVAIHRKGPKNIAFGATRLWNYASEIEAIQDVLRLSKTMSYKSSFAGLQYGGAKAVIMETPLLLERREQIFTAYAKFIESLDGQFITGTDVGLSSSDLEIMAKNSRYIVGTKVNPEHHTGLGLLYAIEAGLEYLYQDNSFKNRTFSILGLGKVGLSILELLYTTSGQIYVSDMDKKKVKTTKKNFPRIIVQNPLELINQPVDIFIPCAVGAAINHQNVSLLRCKAVIGGANNQLEDEMLATTLLERNILYAPDFIVNAGGLISVAHEYENKQINEIEIYEKLLHVKESLRSVFAESRLTNASTVSIAKKIADRFFELN